MHYGKDIQKRVENACTEMISIIDKAGEDNRAFNSESRGRISERKQKARVGDSRIKRLITIHESFLNTSNKYNIKESTLKTIIGLLPII